MGTTAVVTPYFKTEYPIPFLFSILFFWVILDWIVLCGSEHHRCSQHIGFEFALRTGNQLPHIFKGFTFVWLFGKWIRTGRLPQNSIRIINSCETNGGADSGHLWQNTAMTYFPGTISGEKMKIQNLEERDSGLMFKVENVDSVEF